MRQAEGLLVVGANGVARAFSHHPARVQIAIHGHWIPRIPAGMTVMKFLLFVVILFLCRHSRNHLHRRHSRSL
ncbi:MAG: hypothetical protein ACR2P7_06190 [bacterium]